MTAIDTAPFLGLPHATITLASASVTRQNILRAAGVDFNAAPTAIDEIRVRADAQTGDMASDEIAVLLAFLKAQAASQILLPAQSPTHSSLKSSPKLNFWEKKTFVLLRYLKKSQNLSIF